MTFAAVHVSAVGTELPIPNVRSSVANGGKADKICSMRVLRISTHLRHHRAIFAVMHQRRSGATVW
jgi:hypothetical protein